MTRIQVFDPAMCCPTGICGPSVDPNLVRFAADLEGLKSKGMSVDRYNLSVTDPVLRVRQAHEAKHVNELLNHASRVVIEPLSFDRSTSFHLTGVQ
jgi:hypothetical protein